MCGLAGESPDPTTFFEFFALDWDTRMRLQRLGPSLICYHALHLPSSPGPGMFVVMAEIMAVRCSSPATAKRANCICAGAVLILLLAIALLAWAWHRLRHAGICACWICGVCNMPLGSNGTLARCLIWPAGRDYSALLGRWVPKAMRTGAPLDAALFSTVVMKLACWAFNSVTTGR